MMLYEYTYFFKVYKILLKPPKNAKTLPFNFKQLLIQASYWLTYGTSTNRSDKWGVRLWSKNLSFT